MKRCFGVFVFEPNPPPPPPPPPTSHRLRNVIVISVIVIVVLAGVVSGNYLLSHHQPGTTQSPQPTTASSVPPSEHQSGSSPFPTAVASSPGQTPNPSVSSATGGFVEWKSVSYVDYQGIGTKAFSLLIPSDWTFEGSVDWNLDNTAMPAAANIKAYNPNGADEFDIFPNQAFFWTDNPLIQQTNPEGSTYFGALVRSPIGPIDALKEVILPTFRGDAENLNVVSEQNLPQLDALFKTGTDATTGISYSVNSGKIRAEYTLNGVAMEDEMYCVIQHVKIPLQSIYGTTTNDNWYMSYLASFRAEKGTLDTESKTFQTIAYSCSVDKNWLNKYNQIVNYLIQNQIKQIQSIGQLSNILAQTSDQISDENLKDWEQRQSVNDQLVTDFSNQILEIQPYNNPIDGTTVDLPAGYTSAWVNNLGEYVLGEGQDFNPNIGSNMNWQPMTVAGG